MSAIAAVSAILDRLSATDDRDHRFIALKDLHAALSRLSPPAAAASSSSSSASAAAAVSAGSSASSASAALSAAAAAQPPPLVPTAESRLSSCLLLSLLTSASELQELTVSCLSLLPPLSHAASLLSLLSQLLSFVLDPSLPLPGDRSSRQQQWKGRDYEDDEEAEEGGGGAQAVDRRQAAIAALTAVVARLRRDDAELRSAGEKLLPPLMAAVEKERRKGGGAADRALELQLLDLISVFLSHHAAAVGVLHADVLQFLQALLSSSSKQTQKAAILCIAALAPSLSSQLFASLIHAVLARYGKGDAAAYGVIAALSSSAPSALAAYAAIIVAHLGSSLSLPLPAESNTAINDDRAACLLALESLLRGCGEDVLTAVPDLLPALATCLAYDPNLVGDGDEEELQQDDGDEQQEQQQGSGAAGMQQDDDDDGDAEAVDDEYAEAMSDEDVVDEEDTSSRVRRAASRCIIAILTAVSSLLSRSSCDSSASSSSSPSKSKRYLCLHSTIVRLVERITPLLLSRFHERTDHIQVDVLQAAALAIRAAVALRLSLTTLFPQPQLTKGITALMSAHGKAKARLSSSTLQLLAASYRTLALLLSSLPPATLLSQLRPTLLSLSSVMTRALPLCSSSPAAAETMVAAWELVTALLAQVAEAEWVTEVEATARLLVDGLRGGTGRVAVQALGTAEELIEMLSHALADRAKQAKDASLLPMTLLDAACGVETEEERRNSWPSRGDEPAAAADTPPLSAFLSVTSSLSAKELTSITASASRVGPLLQSALLQTLEAAGGDRELKAAALNTVGLLYSHLPVLGSTGESAELWRVLQPHVDSPITRLEAVRAVARVARAAAFLTSDPSPALQPALLHIAASLVGYLKHTDRALQHFALSAVNTVTLRALSLSLHLAAADTSTVSAITVPASLQSLAVALTAAFAPLHSLLSLHGDWLQELESVLTLLSHVVLLSMSCTTTREQTVRTVSTETLPLLLSVVTALPSTALSYSLSLAIASVPALYFFASPPSPSLSSLSSQLSQAFASCSHHHRRALCMLMAATILSSSLSSTRGYSEVKAEIGWKQRPRADDGTRSIVTQLLHSAASTHAAGTQTGTDGLWALGVLGEVGRVHSLSQSVIPQLSALLQPTGDAGADVAAATAFGLVTIGNPTEYFPLLLSRLSSSTAAGSTALYLYSLHELLHHLAFHQVVALSHPFNTATVKPHSIPFPSSSLLLLIQQLSAAMPDPVLPILFSHSVSAQQATHTLAVSSLIRLMALFPAPTLTGVQAVIQQTPELLSTADAEAAQRQSLLVQSLLSALSSFVSVYLSVSSVTSLPSKAIDAEHRNSSDVRPKILPPSTVFTAQLFSLLPFIIPLLSSPSLPLRAGATSLLSSVASHAPQLLTPHLSLLFSSFAAFSLPSPLFTVRKQYGPLAREVDTAMEGRVEGWEMLRLVLDAVDMNSRWFTESEAPPAERDAVIGSVMDSLSAGLDDAVEVQVAVLPLLSAVLRCLPLQPAHVLQLANALRGRVDSVVRADAVGSEVQQHAEMLQAALKAGEEMDAALAADRTLAAVRDSNEWKALLVSMQRRAAAAAATVLPA